MQNSYRIEHYQALSSPKEGVERAIVELLRGWIGYSAWYNCRRGCSITDDPITGKAWAKVGEGLQALSEMETGRLDQGLLAATIVSELE